MAAPSTNTIVQPDLDSLRPRGVTHHHAGIAVPEQALQSDGDFLRLVAQLQDNTLRALTELRSSGMQHLVMGVSATTFWDGRDGALAYRQRLQDHADVAVTCGSLAAEAALNAVGARRIAFFTPYFEVANAQVRRFFQDCGFSVQRDIALQRPSPVQIAHTPQALCRDTLRQLDGDDVDALVQVGTNLSMLRLAAATELVLGKPVIAINAATYWHALRTVGIDDQLDGFGCLFSQH